MKKMILTVAMLLSAAGMQALSVAKTSGKPAQNIQPGSPIRLNVTGGGTFYDPTYSAVQGPTVIQGTPRVGAPYIQTTGGGRVEFGDLEFKVPVTK